MLPPTRSDAHLACPQRVMNGDAGLSDVLVQIGIADAQRRQTLSGERPQRRLGADLLSHPQAGAQNLPIALGGEEVLHDRR